jgi:hypothetical protein
MKITDFDPYQELQQLIKFSLAADKHIKNMLNNEKVLVNELNFYKTKVKHMEERITAIEEKLYEIARKK